MASATEQRDGAVEHDMSIHQRLLVDTCLEEGQFESAIALLEQLRSPNVRPAIHHIRQLIYIALQPEQPLSVNENVNTDVPASPSKATLRKRIPSGSAVLAARRLLNSFSITNSPAAISATLPFYDDPRRDVSMSADDGSIESVIGPQSMCIARAKNCWSILAEGFTQRGQSFPPLTGNRRKRPHNLDEEDAEDHLENTLVGKDAWPVLDWLITLFEQDEILNARGLGCFSTLLLQQIPPPRSATGPRWDAEVPIRIVFFCMEQADVRRQAMGSRLMTLLINLSVSPHMDLTMFVASVYSYLTATNLERLPFFLSQLSPSAAVHRFKVVLCQKLLTGSSQGQSQSGSTRVKARALRAARTEENIMSQSAESIASAQPPKNHIPAFAEVQQWLGTSTLPMITTQSILPRVKFEFLNSYGMLQSEMALAEKDQDWLSLLKSGRAIQFIENVFGTNSGGPEARIYQDVLKGVLLVWSH